MVQIPTGRHFWPCQHADATYCSHRRSCNVSATPQYTGDGGGLRDMPERLPVAPPPPEADVEDFEFDWRAEVTSLAESLRCITTPHLHN